MTHPVYTLVESPCIVALSGGLYMGIAV